LTAKLVLDADCPTDVDLARAAFEIVYRIVPDRPGLSHTADSWNALMFDPKVWGKDTKPLVQAMLNRDAASFDHLVRTLLAWPRILTGWNRASARYWLSQATQQTPGRHKRSSR
jgi:hypothetical protein